MKRAKAQKRAVRSTLTKAHAYLSRLLTYRHPNCVPLDDLLGVCSQIDNMLTGMVPVAEAYTRPDLDQLRADLKEADREIDRLQTLVNAQEQP